MIDYYRRLELPSDGPAAAAACLQVDPPRPPGTSCEFQAVARRLARTAQLLRDTLRHLDAIAGHASLWEGDAADAFKQALKDPGKAHLDLVADRYDGYARSLVAYAGTLDDHQARVDVTRERVSNALDAYHRTRSATHPPTSCGAPRPDSQLAGSAAVQDCATAAQQFQDAYNDWIQAALRCQRGIKEVDADALHNAHGCHAAVNTIASIANEVSSLSAVLAIVALPLAPELSLFLLSLSSMASAAKLGADVDRRAQYGEKVGWDAFALDALGSIPVLRAGEEGVAAVKAAKAVGTLGKLGRGGTAFAKAFGHEVVNMFGRDGVEAGRGLTAAGFRGVFGKPSARRAWTNLNEWEKQDLLGYPASWADQAGNDRRHGWVNAVTWSVFRVTWQPIDALLPDAVERRVARTLSTAGSAVHAPGPAVP